jgi:fructosamine-3-kinase
MIDLSHSAELLLGSSVRASRRLSGGDLSTVVALDLADGRRVIAKQGADVAIEAGMLRAMAASGAPVPQVFAVEDGLLLMARVEADSGPSGAWDTLADVLAQLHACHGPEYGWDSDYAFGPVTISNRCTDDWAAFWADNRLRCHLPHVDAPLSRRIETLADRCGELLPCDPAPSLLHGDLWGGNVLVANGRVTGLIDPACYHGDREVDAAMLTLFDHPPVAFFERMGLAPGWERRQPLYRLWPLLVHLRLFGASYRGAVEAELSSLGF